MSAGKRDTFITVEQLGEGRDPTYNTPVHTWTTFAQMWAEVLDVLPSRSERLDDSIQIARQPARVRVDYLDGQGVTSSMRMQIEGRTYEIVAGPAEKGVRDMIEFMVERVSTQGDG